MSRIFGLGTDVVIRLVIVCEGSLLRIKHEPASVSRIENIALLSLFESPMYPNTFQFLLVKTNIDTDNRSRVTGLHGLYSVFRS